MVHTLPSDMRVSWVFIGVLTSTAFCCSRRTFNSISEGMPSHADYHHAEADSIIMKDGINGCVVERWMIGKAYRFAEDIRRRRSY